MEDTPGRNPRETASFFSLLTFSWLNSILKLGSRQPLEEKNLFTIETSHQAERLVGDLEKEWLAEEKASEQNRRKARLWKAMVRVFSYRDYIIMGLLRIFYSITLNALPLILWFFLRSIATVSETSYTSTLPLVIGIAVVSVARSLCVGHALFKAEIMAVRLKVAMAGLVYKKASSIKLKGNSERQRD